MPERDHNGYVRTTDGWRDHRGSSSGPGPRNHGHSSSVSSRDNRDYDDYKGSSNGNWERDRSARYRSHSVEHQNDYYQRDNYDHYDRRSSKDDYYERNGRSSHHQSDYYGRGGGRGYDQDTHEGDYYEDKRDSQGHYQGSDRGRNGGNGDGRDRGRDGDDWRCPECCMWNFPNEKQCARCGLDQLKERQSSPSSKGGDADPRNKKDEEKVWPPCFEDDGDVFVLDARSGMFYESESDFFYDPTSKLYYGNKKQAYFSYNAEKKTFVPINEDDGECMPAPPAGSSAAVTDQDHLLLVPNGANPNNKESTNKKIIAIKLKTVPKSDKKRKKRSESNVDTSKQSTTLAAEPVNKIPKQHAVNMEIWQEREREKLQRVSAGSSGGTAKHLFTKNGNPVCWVCKRKFASKEKLELHEAKSKLHQENLVKQREPPEASAVKPAVESANYVDRAKQRRDLYGPELVLPSLASSAVKAAPEDTPGGQDRPLENPSNIGHQMLEKLGWKAGKALGRGSEQQQEQQAALAQDWDRIENIAAQNTYNSGPSSYGRRVR